MPIYMRLFHGRKDPKEQLSDWGEDGPVFGPYDYYHTTYLTHLRMGCAQADPDELTIIEELLYYDGVYYGDWSVFDEGVLKEGGLAGSVVPFEEGKAKLPKDDLNASENLVCQGTDSAREEMQRVRCPGCGLPVDMPVDWDGKDPEEALCNKCCTKRETAALMAAATKHFSGNELLVIFEAARIAMADREVFDSLAEQMDLADEEMIAVREKLLTFMEKDGCPGDKEAVDEVLG